jgi:SAM-dependent methyltransferase
MTQDFEVRAHSARKDHPSRATMMTQPLLACPVCQSTEVEPFFRLRGVPVCANVLWNTPQEAQLCARGDIELTICRSCGMISNSAFDPALVTYDPRYENSLHFSPFFQEYAERLARRLIQEYALEGKTVIEIGCGKGDFLALLCRLGGNLGVGFDPSYVNGRVDATAGKGLSVIPDGFSAKYADLECDLLCCRHTLEHISNPLSFLTEIRRTLGHRQVPIFFEVPNALFTLRQGGIWDVIYEHCSYFSPPSMSYLFRQARLNVRKVAEDFDGQFLCMDAVNPNGTQSAAPTRPEEALPGEVAQIVQDARKLGLEFQVQVDYWKKELRALLQSGKRVVVWGAGAKGVTFLNAVGEKGIEYVVDLNGHKHGRYISGTGQQVVPPAFLREYRPDVVLVMNPIYRNEIRDQIWSLGMKMEVFDERNHEHDVCRLQFS